MDASDCLCGSYCCVGVRHDPIVAGPLVPLDPVGISQGSGVGPTQPFFTIIFSCASLVLLPSGGVASKSCGDGYTGEGAGLEWNRESLVRVLHVWWLWSDGR